ncbi:MAG TPA: trypsin-like peptidase domain-containing protein [Gemmatales bacterium]|nr:trypsin-like peptidase domain-containing protein [Gemmatales bacterium]
MLRTHRGLWSAGLLLLAASTLAVGAGPQDEPGVGVDPRIRSAEERRLATIAKVRPAVVAVFGRDEPGGGSGVLISPDGYALTNFHVVEPCGPFPRCGLPDGLLYEAVLVGLDPVGDVALIKLHPREPNKPFPFVALGDSDAVQVGDWALAMGNPFLLATDFTPTITYGIVSGTHRYQYPAGTILEYTDCIQTEASINPGNSGGPLFNLDGELIGINGRGSFEKRGRVNSGVGYAISINQIKHFMGHLRGGLIVDHATLGAVVRTNEDGRLEVDQLLETSDAYRRGVRSGDELLGFAGRPLGSVNQFKNVLGIFPKGTRLPLVYRHRDSERQLDERREVLVRLLGVQPRELQRGQPRRPPQPPGPPQPRPDPEPGPRPQRPQPTRPAKKPLPDDLPTKEFFKKKEGFANYFFNELERGRVFEAWAKLRGPALPDTPWTWQGEVVRPVKRPARLRLTDKIAEAELGDARFTVEPLKAGESLANLAEPAGSGGLLMALYQYRRLLVLGPDGFEGGCHYGGQTPFYPTGLPEPVILADLILTEHAGVACHWFFDPATGQLLGMECWLEPSADPCEIVFHEPRDLDGHSLPHRLEVRTGDREFAVISLSQVQLGKP